MTKLVRTSFLAFIAIIFFNSSYAQKPKAFFSATELYLCEFAETRLVDKSTDADSIFWELGDGDTSHRKRLSHSYSGLKNTLDSFKVTLYAFNSEGSDTFSNKIVVQAKATALFRDSLIAKWAQYINLSKNYLGLSWDFGDGTTSISDIDIISKFYKKAGTYNVSLIANTDYGCNDTFKKTIVIVDSAESGITEKNPYKMELFPNPFNDLSIFAFELNNSTNLKLTVSDAIGKSYFYETKTFATGKNQLNIGQILSNADSGMYFISITDNEATYIIKASKK